MSVDTLPKALPRTFSQRVAVADPAAVARYLRYVRVLEGMGPNLYYRLRRSGRLRPRGMTRAQWRRLRRERERRA